MRPEKRLQKAEEALMKLTSKINVRKLKTQEVLLEAIDSISAQYKAGFCM